MKSTSRKGRERKKDRGECTQRGGCLKSVCFLIHLPISTRVDSNFSNSAAYISINFCPLSIFSSTPGPSVSNLLTNSSNWKCKVFFHISAFARKNEHGTFLICNFDIENLKLKCPRGRTRWGGEGGEKSDGKNTIGRK